LKNEFFFDNSLNNYQRLIKRVFDLFFSFAGLMILFVPLVMMIILASFSTGHFGLFRQERVGQYGKTFGILKIRTMKGNQGNEDFITLAGDKRITGFGRFLRKYKLDELPQLWNVLAGEMSLVGPRPDVRGFSDELRGRERVLLSLKPGITGLASIHYKDEEELLARQKDPISFNKNVIWPNKVQLNMQYLENWSLLKDISCIIKTF
jgi:lipopolysaccharide/colanic/teichoic acid biosynthesis glycosyltransferase